MSALCPYPKFKAFDANGRLLSGGLLYSYVPGTSTATAKATYSDAALTTENTNPVVLDSNGEASVYLAGATKLVLKSSAGVTAWTLDNVTGFGGAIGGATYLVDSSETDQGAVGGGRSLKDIVDAVGSTKKATIVFTHTGVGNTTAYTLTTSETITSNFDVVFEKGAVIDGAGTLTIAGGFVGADGCFGSTLTVAFSSGLCICPEWWGAVGDDGTNDYVALNKAFSSSNTKSTIVLSKVYKTETTLTVTTFPNVSGIGGRVSAIKHYGTGAAIQIGNDSTHMADRTWSNFTINNQNATSSPYAVDMYGGSRNFFRDLTITTHTSSSTAWLLRGNTSDGATAYANQFSNKWSNCRVTGASLFGFQLGTHATTTDAGACRCNNNIFDGVYTPTTVRSAYVIFGGGTLWTGCNIDNVTTAVVSEYDAGPPAVDQVEYGYPIVIIGDASYGASNIAMGSYIDNMTRPVLCMTGNGSFKSYQSGFTFNDSLGVVKLRPITGSHGSSVPVLDYLYTAYTTGAAFDLATGQFNITDATSYKAYGRNSGINHYGMTYQSNEPIELITSSHFRVGLAYGKTSDTKFKLYSTGDLGENYTEKFSIDRNGKIVSVAAPTTHTISAFDDTNNRFTIASHGLGTGQKVVYNRVGGDAISALTIGTLYFVYVVDADTISICTTEANALAGTVKTYALPDPFTPGSYYFITGGPIGSFTCDADDDTQIFNAAVTSSSLIFLSPTNADAAALMGSAKSLYIQTVADGSFIVDTADGNNAAGTETFSYFVIN